MFFSSSSASHQARPQKGESQAGRDEKVDNSRHKIFPEQHISTPSEAGHALFSLGNKTTPCLILSTDHNMNYHLQDDTLETRGRDLGILAGYSSKIISKLISSRGCCSLTRADVPSGQEDIQQDTTTTTKVSVESRDSLMCRSFPSLSSEVQAGERHWGREKPLLIKGWMLDEPSSQDMSAHQDISPC